MGIFSKSRPATSSEFSRFIREASSQEKKRVYTDVIKRATDRQREVLDKARRTGSG